MRHSRILGRAVALVSVAAIATSIAVSRSSQLLIVAVVVTAMVWGAAPQALDAFLGSSEREPPRPDLGPGTFTIAVHIGGRPGELSRVSVTAATTTAPTVVVASDPAAVELLGPVPCPVILGRSVEEAINDVATSLETDALLILSAGSYVDRDAAAQAAGSIAHGAAWVVGRSRTFNRDGFSPLVRGRLGRRLRASARAAGLQLWEPNATMLSTELVRDHPLEPGRPWGSILRSLQTLGFHGQQQETTLSMTAEPVDARSYWPASVVRRRRAVTDLADAAVTTRGRQRWLATGLLLRELDGFMLAIWLLCPWLLTRSDTLAFRCSVWVLLMLAALPALLRWIAQRAVHRARLHPLEDMLALAFEAPASVLALPTVFTRRVRPTRLRLPAQPLVAAGLIFAAFATVPLFTDGTTAHRRAAVGLALTELGLLWLMAMRVIFQRNWTRSIYRIRSRLPTVVDGRTGTTADVSPSGIAVEASGAPMVVGSDVAIEIALDDGSILSSRGTVEDYRLRGARPVAGISLRVSPADRNRWIAQLSHSVAQTRHVHGKPRLPATVGRPAVINRWLRGALAGSITLVSVAATATLSLSLVGYRPLIVRSASMEPALGVGDVVLVEDVEARQLEVGDIATFADVREVGDSLTHRVVSVVVTDEVTTVTTRGDANVDDETFTLSAHAIVGRVVTRIAAVGTLIAWAGSNSVRTGAAVLGIVVVCWVLWRGRTADDRPRPRRRLRVGHGQHLARTHKP